MARGVHNSKVIRRIAIIFSGITLSIAFTAACAMNADNDNTQGRRPTAFQTKEVEYAAADPCGSEFITCDYSPDQIVSLIEKYAPNKKMFATAKRIGFCESRFDQYARNPNSSAKGVFQFTDRTFEKYCTGNVFDADDNIKCFFRLYPEHPTWWACK